MSVKKVWRRVFGGFLIGDRVKIINQNWVYKNQIGIITVTTVHEGTRYYLVKLSSNVLNRLLPGKRSYKPDNQVGYFKAKDLELVHGNSKSGPPYLGSGRVYFSLPEKKTTGIVIFKSRKNK